MAFCRFKEAIQPKLDEEGNRYGAKNLKMKSCHSCHIPAVAFYRWPIQGQTLTDRNCKLLAHQLKSIDFIFLRFFSFHFVRSFITYRSCRHLDGKHTIFGKLVGGLDTLNEMEKIEVDNKDRPIEDITIEKVTKKSTSVCSNLIPL